MEPELIAIKPSGDHLQPANDTAIKVHMLGANLPCKQKK